jgi:hypothetical protein
MIDNEQPKDLRKHNESVFKEVCRSEIYGRLIKTSSERFYLPDASASQVVDLIKQNRPDYNELVKMDGREEISRKKTSTSYAFKVKSFDLGQPLGGGER